MALGGRLGLKRLVKLVLLSFCAFSVSNLLMRRYRGSSDPFQGLTQIKKSWTNSLSKLEIMALKQEAQIVEAAEVVEREWAWVPKEAAPVPKEAAPVPKEAAPVPKKAAPVPKDEAPAINLQVQATTPKTPTRTKATVRTPWLKITPPYSDPSYIGDQYAQEDNPFLSTGCPNSIRQRILASDFRLFYLPKIPIFQWAKHAMPEEFERLRWYNGCFGWNLTSWNYTKEVLSLLNTSANGYMFTDWNRKLTSVSPCIRCAVVGNGGILNGSKVGREIDQHDYVFRVNAAVLNGHEADVGNRTSFYFFSTNTMINSLYSYAREGFRHIPQSEKTSYIFIPDNGRDYFMMKAILTHSPVERGQDMSVKPSIYFGENYRAEQFKLLHPDFLRYLRNRFLPSDRLRQPNRDIYRPSSGAAMLLAAIHTCDEVSAYGFITPDYKKYSDHYYDLKKQELTFYANHDFIIERDLWQRLHQQGIIKLYSRT